MMNYDQQPIIRPVNYVPNYYTFVSDVLQNIAGRVTEVFTERGVLVKVHERSSAATAELLKIRATETMYEIAIIAQRATPNDIVVNLYRHTDRFTAMRGERETILSIDYRQPYRLDDVLNGIRDIVEEFMIPNPLNLRPPKARFVVEMDRPEAASKYVATAFRITKASYAVVDSNPVVRLENAYGNVIKDIPLADKEGREIKPNRLIGQFYIGFIEGDHLIKSEMVFGQNFVVAGSQGPIFVDREHNRPSRRVLIAPQFSGSRQRGIPTIPGY